MCLTKPYARVFKSLIPKSDIYSKSSLVILYILDVAKYNKNIEKGIWMIQREALFQSICLDYNLISNFKISRLLNWTRTRKGILDNAAYILLSEGGGALLELPKLSIHVGMNQ